MSTDNDVQEMYRSNPLIKALSELPQHVLAQNLVHLAEWANSNSTKNFLHYRFMPDDPVLELCVHHLTQQGFRLSSEQTAKLTECEEELVEDNDFEGDEFEDDEFEDDDFEDDDFEDDATETSPEEGEEVTVIPHKAPSLKFSSDLSHNLDDEEDSGPVHRLIIGDNYQALAGLQAGLATHPKGIYDLIYIDPPYNTGNGDFRYNDLRVDPEDRWRSTKWASFMETRLILAKRLLKKTGVIFIAIDDNEHHSLRLLCDSVLGRRNFIANLVWDAPGTNTAKFVKGGVDYMLAYATNKDAHLSAFGGWHLPRPGKEEMLELVDSVRRNGGTPKDAESELQKWIKTAKQNGVIGDSEAAYSKVDETCRVYMVSPVVGAGYRPNLMYPITDPATGKVYLPPVSGKNRRWRWSEDKMLKEIASGKVFFTNTSPMQKTYLDESGDALLKSVFYRPRNGASSHLEAVIGDSQFDHPKDHIELARWFSAVAPKDAKILDFFGGSGTTAEAVLMLNQQDGGTREVTIITSDEENIGTEVTRERIVRVMTGEGWADGKIHKGYGGRLGVWFADTVEVIDFENDREQGETDHHSWDRGAGQWGAWHLTPILLEQTKSYDVYGGENGMRSIVFHNIDYLNGKLVDEVMGDYPGAQVFLPHSHTYKTVPNSFYVDDVPNAIPLPLGVWSPIQSGVSASVVDSYAKRGGAYIEFIHKLIEQNSATE